MPPRGLSSLAKQVLARVGTLLPARTVHGMRVATGYVAVGSWVAGHGYAMAPRVAGRNQVFDAMLALVRDEPVAYLEFGVFDGISLRYWSTALTRPDAELHGFDSFLGLPESFDASMPLGYFDRGGTPPAIDDDRVTFHVGWFDATLPQFTVPSGKRLVIALDADLYSATRLVLDTLDPHIVVGTLVYFDDLSRIDHEPAAFDDYMSTSGKSFRPLAFEATLNTGAFICTSAGAPSRG